MTNQIKEFIKLNISMIKHFKNSFIDRNSIFIIFLYHRLTDKKHYDDYFGTKINIKLFIKQLEFLNDKFNIVSFSELNNNFNTKENKIKAALTFDDGYLDNYLEVLPILNRFKIKATFFLPTNFIGKNYPIWDAQIYSALKQSKKDLVIQDLKNNFYAKRSKDDMLFLKNIINYCKYLEYPELKEFINKFYKDLGLFFSFNKNDRCMNWNEVRELRKHGMEIGSHGKSHLSFKNMSKKQAMKELLDSKEQIESELNIKCNYFSFPFGSYNDFDDQKIEIVKSSNYTRCLLNIHGYNDLKDNNYALKRIIMHKNKNLSFILS